MPDGLEILTLGGLQIARDGAPLVGLASRKAEALLVYLACADGPQARDVLADLLWDDLPAARARGNLSVLLTGLRQALGPYLEVGRHAVALRPAGPLLVDAAELTRAVAAALGGARDGAPLAPDLARGLEAAVARYRGEFLHGFALRDGAGFEAWARAEQERLRAVAARARLALVATALHAGDHAAGVGHAQALLRLDPLHEEAHFLLLQLYARSGQRAAALAHYEELCRTLEEELGAAPAPRTTELYRAIWQGSLAPAPRAPAPAARRGELRGAPFLATSFLGRERELAAVAERLRDPGCRLLALVGPGGVGKTRLALQAAAERASALADGAVFVPLAGLAATGEAPAAIAAALRFGFRGQAAPLAQLSAFLAERELLLVLDNAEHLDGLADTAIALLAATPRVQILVTSRERLGLQAEWVVELGGLELPPAEPDLAALDASAAARLFVQRARAGQPAFRAEAAPPAAVARICRLVDGLPLAIELAAALVPSRPCPAIADAIARDLDVLATELRDIPARHRSLRAVFDQSWALLRAEERDLLSRLSVFRGAFSAAAAEEVCGGGPLAGPLAALAARSLLRAGDGGRYSAHELLRQFAAEGLGRDEAGRVAAAHARHFLALAGARAAELHGPGLPAAAAALRADLDNLRAAWRWAAESGSAGLLAAGSPGLIELYDLDGLFEEGAAMFGSAVASLRGAGPGAELGRLIYGLALFELRLGRYAAAAPLLEESIAMAAGDAAFEAEARLNLGQCHWRLGDGASARAEGERALGLARGSGARRTEAAVERLLAFVTHNEGDRAAGEAHLRRAIGIARELDDTRDLCRGLNLLGSMLETRGAYEESCRVYDEALALARALGDRWSEGVILGNLGNSLRDLGDYDGAAAAYDEALALYRATGDRYGEGILRFSLGNITCDVGDYAAAEAHYDEALRISLDLGDRAGEALAMMGLGHVARDRGETARAAELCRRAYDLAAQLRMRPFEAVTALYLGHALCELGEPGEAARLFAAARDIRAAIGDHHRAAEALAGLARAALASGDAAGAARYAAPVAEWAAAAPLAGVSEPFLIYLLCHRALLAGGDSRAAALLAAGRALLRERAERIADPARRASFLAVPAHRELLGPAPGAAAPAGRA